LILNQHSPRTVLSQASILYGYSRV
jgi:hypothetical protein